MKRKDLEKHLTKCNLRPYRCEFCGLKDTYKAITGQDSFHGFLLEFGAPWVDNPYGGHQAKCPEAPLICPNKCGSNVIRRKHMEIHRSQCPQEPVECLFTEAGCKQKLKRCQLNTHLTSCQQEHLSLVMKDYRETKRELHEVKGTLATAVQLLRQGTEADKEMVDYVVACSMRLEKVNNLVKILMPKFSEYRRSGKVWHSPPFYYREGYKMCLAVYANGVGKGAGTHVSVALLLFKGDKKHQPVEKCCKYSSHHTDIGVILPSAKLFHICQYQPLSQYSEEIKELSCKETFCTHKYIASKLVNDRLTFNITYVDDCDLHVSL